MAASSIAVLRWLNLSGVDYVLVGAVARAIRGDATAEGPVDIVPAPYGRNLDRLASGLNGVGVSERTHGELVGAVHSVTGQQFKLAAEMLVRGDRWTLNCGEYELDVEGRPTGTPSYQELLYEAVRFQVSPEVAVEVAAPEDIEHYDHVRRTGLVPEMTVKRL